MSRLKVSNDGFGPSRNVAWETRFEGPDAAWLDGIDWEDHVFKLRKPDGTRAHYLFRVGYCDNQHFAAKPHWAFWVRDTVRHGFPARAAARSSAITRLRHCIFVDAGTSRPVGAYDRTSSRAHTLVSPDYDMRRIAARSYKAYHYKA